MNKDLSKVTIYAPVSILIGISYGAARDFTSDAHMIQFRPHRSQTAFDITEDLAISQLSKRHAKELIIACKRANTVITVITINALTKFLNGEEVHDLREYDLSCIHCLPLSDVFTNHQLGYQAT